MLHYRLGLYHYLTCSQRYTYKDCCLPGPTLTLGFILATLFGAAFHLVVGGDARRLALYLLAGWVGFGIGHLLGVSLNVNLLNIGPLRIVSASIGALVALFAANALSTNRTRKSSVR